MMYSSVIITFTLFLCVISLWIRWRKRKYSLFQRCGIPGPKPNFLNGNLTEFNKGREKCIKEWVNQYGKVFGFYFGTKPYVICADVELLKLIQTNDVYIFRNKFFVLSDGGISHDSYIKMLPFRNDKDYKDLRCILSNCFSTGKIKMMSTLMSHPIELFLKNIEKQGTQQFNIVELSKNLIFDIICTSAFGITTNVQNNESNIFIKSVSSTFEPDTTDILTTLSICFRELESVCTFLRHKIDYLKYMLNLPSLRVVYEYCQKIINSRKKAKHNSKDLLQTMIDIEDLTLKDIKKLTDDFVIANAMLFMAVGYDTTRVTLDWCIYYLARNPEIQEKVRQEIKSNVPDDMEIQYTDFNNLQLLNQVISETLRIKPLSLAVTNRVCSEDYHYKGMTIPEGCVISVPVQILQNDPEYWNEPDKFDPNRFSSANRGEIDSTRYHPFGFGQRSCVGQRLAKAILGLILANLVRTFKLESVGDENTEMHYTLFVYHPKNGVIIKATPIIT